jgi:hypothetical protein
MKKSKPKNQLRSLKKSPRKNMKTTKFWKRSQKKLSKKTKLLNQNPNKFLNKWHRSNQQK